MCSLIIECKKMVALLFPFSFSMCFSKASFYFFAYLLIGLIDLLMYHFIDLFLYSFC